VIPLIVDAIDAQSLAANVRVEADKLMARQSTWEQRQSG